MPEGLCWECKEKLDKASLSEIQSMIQEATIRKTPFFLSCHHEPKDKPKCKCYEVSLGDGCSVIFIDNVWRAKLNFCPECGREL